MTAELITKSFNGTPFVFREDGWFNMTKAAQAFGKKLSHFWDSPDTTSYVEAVGQLPEFRGIELEDARKGRYGGTWAHPKLAVFFARWLDVKFAVWCDAVIEDILKGVAQVTIVKPEQSAALALPQDYASALRALADALLH